MNRGTCRFALPADIKHDDVLAALKHHFTLRASPTTRFVRRYFDSFDWSLHNAGGTLYQEIAGGKQQLYWEKLSDETPKYKMAIKEMPRFAHDLPPGRFRDDLASVVKYRALLPLAEVRHHRRVYRILDDNEKTVVRLAFEAQEASAQGLTGEKATRHATLHVLPVKGYDAAYEAACHALCALPDLVLLDNHPFLSLLAALDRTPGDTTAAGDLTLDPSMRTDVAVNRLLSSLLYTITLNEPGVRADLDSEFLHDFRVAVRRTRSVLGQIEDVLPTEVLDHFSPEFQWLGDITGSTRDLDVYLLKFDTYLSWLPEGVQQDLSPLHDFLRDLQAREHTRLVAALDTPRYRTLLDEWRGFLEKPVPDTPRAPEAARPVMDVASERIWHAYKKVLKRGRVIMTDPDASASLLHKLRIACKKLRYLMELFRSLYPPSTIKQLIQALKQLQDNLGDYNDFEVQQATLHRFALQMTQEGTVPAETILAMGRLEARLDTLQREAHDAFTERYTLFASPANHQQFKALFKTRSA